jgi:hypothetical protein
MRDHAREEIPAPRTCRVRLYDDGTFRADIRHAAVEDEYYCIRYERTTSEIVREHRVGAGWEATSFADGETVYESSVEEIDVRVCHQSYREHEQYQKAIILPRGGGY